MKNTWFIFLFYIKNIEFIFIMRNKNQRTKSPLKNLHWKKVKNWQQMLLILTYDLTKAIYNFTYVSFWMLRDKKTKINKNQKNFQSLRFPLHYNNAKPLFHQRSIQRSQFLNCWNSIFLTHTKLWIWKVQSTSDIAMKWIFCASIKVIQLETLRKRC